MNTGHTAECDCLSKIGEDLSHISPRCCSFGYGSFGDHISCNRLMVAALLTKQPVEMDSCAASSVKLSNRSGLQRVGVPCRFSIVILKPAHVLRRTITPSARSSAQVRMRDIVAIDPRCAEIR